MCWDKKMEIYKLALFGHRDLNSHITVERGLYRLFNELIKTKAYIEIYIGRNGEFDVYTASVIRGLQKTFGYERINMTLVLPYAVKDIEYYEKYYSSIIIPECTYGVHHKRAITERNRWMIRKCDMCVCFTERESGGAYTAMQYAKQKGKKVLNLAQE